MAVLSAWRPTCELLQRQPRLRLLVVEKEAALAQHQSGHNSGVSAQALTADGRLVDDFLICRDDRVLHVQNALSPVATSSLYNAGKIVEAAVTAPH